MLDQGTQNGPVVLAVWTNCDLDVEDLSVDPPSWDNRDTETGGDSDAADGANGRNGKTVNLRTNGKMKFSGGSVLNLMAGGQGQSTNHVASGAGASSSATGGNGGKGGSLKMAAGGGFTFSEGATLTINPGKGGNGGLGTSRGGEGGKGNDGDTCNGGKGGVAQSTGGKGGDVSFSYSGPGALDPDLRAGDGGDATSARTSGGAGGNNAPNQGGNGGDGNSSTANAELKGTGSTVAGPEDGSPRVIDGTGVGGDCGVCDGGGGSGGAWTELLDGNTVDSDNFADGSSDCPCNGGGGDPQTVLIGFGSFLFCVDHSGNAVSGAPSAVQWLAAWSAEAQINPADFLVRLRIDGPDGTEFIEERLSTVNVFFQLGIFSFGAYEYRVISVTNTQSGDSIEFTGGSGSDSVDNSETNKGQCTP